MEPTAAPAALTTDVPGPTNTRFVPPRRSPEGLDAHGLRAALVAFRDALRAHQQVLNRLNVYPVPDGDTGTNMALTLDAVVQELDKLKLDKLGEPGSLASICRAMAHGSLMGARGNSGVILSQLLRGLADRLGACECAGPEDLAGALVTASDLAYKAVVRPVEGTILTVARAAGQGAAEASASGHPLVGVVEGARGRAADALAETPKLLDVLARAGVVDAGGTGYVLWFDALLHVLDGRPLPPPPEGASAGDSPGAAAGTATGSTAEGREQSAACGPGYATAVEGGPAMVPDQLRYEVMYLLDAPDETIGAFKEVWAGIGDSIVVVGGDGLWNCHIHTNEIGAAIESAIDIGRPRQIRVTDLSEQVEEERWVRDAPAEPDDGAGLPVPQTAVVAVVAGEGVGRIFRSLGVQRLVPGGQSMNPSTAQLLEAVESLASTDVVVLPNNDNIEPVAAQVDRLSTKTVRVVPTGSIVEGFAALMAYDPATGAEENAASMAASADRVVPAAITRAVRDSTTEAGPVTTGQWLGLARAGVVSVAASPAEAAIRLLNALLADGHELVTVIEGEGATAGDTRRITEWLHDEHPNVVAEIHHGGQPHYPYLLGLE